jgi:hypothetical protein
MQEDMTDEEVWLLSEQLVAKLKSERLERWRLKEEAGEEHSD